MSGPRHRSLLTWSLLAEFVVIVAGVLAALAVDEWRESRQEREIERELLASFVHDLRADSIDFARLPVRAIGRVRAAEVLLRNLSPGSPRGVRLAPVLDTLGAVPAPATDAELAAAFAALLLKSDLDVARGAYRQFAEGGGQRLVRNDAIRQRIHEYHHSVESSARFGPWVDEALGNVRSRANDLGLGTEDGDGRRIRSILSDDSAGPFFASVRSLQVASFRQAGHAAGLLEDVSSLLALIRAELDAG